LISPKRDRLLVPPNSQTQWADPPDAIVILPETVALGRVRCNWRAGVGSFAA